MYHVGESFLKKEFQLEMDFQVDQFGSLHSIDLDFGSGLNLKNDSLWNPHSHSKIADNV